MSINKNIREVSHSINNIGENLIDIRDVAETMIQHFDEGFNVYESNAEARSDLKLVLRSVKNIQKEIYGED